MWLALLVSLPAFQFFLDRRSDQRQPILFIGARRVDPCQHLV